MSGQGWRRTAICAISTLLFGFSLLNPTRAVEPAPSPHPAIWKVQNGARTVYLFGSLHILPRPLAWDTPEIDAAMQASGIFVFEVPSDAKALSDEKSFIVQHGLMPRGVSLRAALTPGEFQIYTSVLRRAGLKPEQYERYRPWLAAVVLGLAYLHPENVAFLTGADDFLIDYARANGKEIRYFETVDTQMQLLSRTGDYAQLKALKRLIRTLPQTRNQEIELFESWVAGDTDRLAGLVDGYFKDYAAMEHIMIGNRNRSWLARIEEFLTSSDRTIMVTVGAAHLGGEHGLVQLLCADGYNVERLGSQGAKICGQKA